MNNLYQIEDDIRKYWNDIKLDLLIKKKAADFKEVKKMFIGPLGPATKNSKPSIHHVYMKTIRDAIIRYNFMNGYHVEKKIYWEAHGSSVEKQAKKELRIVNQKDIQNFGVERYCDYCRNTLFDKYNEFQTLSRQIGEFETLNSKSTTDDVDYVETVWWILKRMYDDNLIQKGQELINYCDKCSNIINNFEAVNNRVQETTTSALILLPMNIENEIIYIAIDCMDVGILPYVSGIKYSDDITLIEHYENKSRWILSTETAQKYKIDGDLLLNNDVRKLFCLPVDFVDHEINIYKSNINHVNLSFWVPGIDSSDFEYAKNNAIEINNYITSEGRFLFNSINSNTASVKKTEEKLFQELKEKKQVFFEKKSEKISNLCPFCNSTLYKAVNNNLILKTSNMKKQLIDNANKINWIPESHGKKRMIEWIDNIKDWNISRNRTFGTPIPLYECECGFSIMMGSISEFKRYIHDEETTYHHIYASDMDKWTIECPKCHKLIKRVPYILDCWFDSGAFPLAQYHYPFENSYLSKKKFMADIIIEGLDQTRGWFYTLLVINSYLFNEIPAKNIITVNMLLDENGKKMSKVRGTVISPFEIIENTGADALRWALLRHSPVWNNVNFRNSDVINVQYHFIDKLFSILNYIDKYEINNFIFSTDHPLCIWLWGKTNQLIQKTRNYYEEYKLNMVCLEINNFVDRVLSKQYLHYIKELRTSKKVFMSTLIDVYNILLKLIAPIMPHMSEYLFQKLNKNEQKISIHLTEFPTYKRQNTHQAMKVYSEIQLLDRVIHNVISIKANRLLNVSGTIVVQPHHYKILIKYKEILLACTKCKDMISDVENKYIVACAECNREKYGLILREKLKDYCRLISELQFEEINCILRDGSIYKEGKEITKDLIVVEGTIKKSCVGKKEKELCVVII